MTEPPIALPSPPSSPFAEIMPTAMRVLTDPQAFFASMPREGGYEAPGIFAAAMLVAYAAVFALFSLLHFHIVAMLAALVLMPIFGAIVLGIGSAVLMFVSRALGGEASFESSFRIASYASALSPVAAVCNIVPYLPILVQAYGLYIVIIAVIEVHKVAEEKAWKVLGAIGAVILVFTLWSTFTARRVAPQLEELNRQLERSAAEMSKAGENFRQELDRAMQKMDKAANEREAE